MTATAYSGFSQPINTHAKAVEDKSVLYFITSGDLVKVGITNDIERRLDELRLGNPHPLTVKVRSVPRALARQVEKAVHVALAPHSVGREWFRCDASVALAASRSIIARAETANWRLHMDGLLMGTEA